MNSLAAIHILATIHRIALKATEVIEGVRVTRTSITGFVVASTKATLDAANASTTVESTIAARLIDASWTELAAEVVAVAAKVTRVARADAHTFFCAMVDAIAAIRGMATMTLKTARETGVKRVVVTCYGGAGATMDQHNEAAARVARALRNDGHRAVAVGHMVEVFAN